MSILVDCLKVQNDWSVLYMILFYPIASEASMKNMDEYITSQIAKTLR